MFEREFGEGSSIGKLEVGKVPVQDLTVARREVDRATVSVCVCVCVCVGGGGA